MFQRQLIVQVLKVDQPLADETFLLKTYLHVYLSIYLSIYLSKDKPLQYMTKSRKEHLHILKIKNVIAILGQQGTWGRSSC